MPFFQTRRNVPEDKRNCESVCLSDEIMNTASYTSALVVGSTTGKFVLHAPQQLTHLSQCSLILKLNYEYYAVLQSVSKHKCNTQSSAPEDGQNNCLKHVEMIEIINKLLLLHLVGCLCYLYQ